MIAADQWRAYNEAVDSIRSAAEAEVREGVASWLEGHPGATVAEAREEAARIMCGAVQRHDKAAASLAAEWYDAQGRAQGARLDRAVTAPAFSAEAVSRLARYQVRKYQDGDLAGFAAMCGEFAANDAMRSVNDTILRNARRDKSRGARFARVTSGRNTCAFCLMLAGRGAVYHTRESAGAFSEWHRHCTCKVVPSFSGDQWETLVEGRDPKAICDRLREIERLTGARQGSAEFSREVALRDPEWLYGGEASISFEEGHRHEQREVQTAEWLRARGMSCEFRKTRENESKRTSDVRINGVPWEFKQPKGTGKNNINNQFNEASGQSDHLVIDCSRSPFSFEEICVKARDCLSRRSDFSQVIVIDSEHFAHFTK